MNYDDGREKTVRVSTLPFFLKAIKVEKDKCEQGLVFDLLACCFHLVIDDADAIMDCDPEKVKLLLKEWTVCRANAENTNFCQQLIVTATTWTKYISRNQPLF